MSGESRDCDVLVVGVGPAGIAAACCAAESGRSVTVVDDNPALGGQIWRGSTQGKSDKQAAKWFVRFSKTKKELISGSRVVNGDAEARVLQAETADGALDIHYQELILATGARELFLPFPGWTLPNVMGAGGLQVMVKSGLPIKRKRVAVAGSGPLLLAVAAYLRKHGAEIVQVAEQAPWSKLCRFGMGLAAHPKKVIQAIGLQSELLGIRYLAGCWPVAAEGDGKLERIRFRHGDKTWTEACDYLACGFGLVPNLELPQLMGCETANDSVVIDDQQKTSVAHVYCAGETTGIGGVDLSLVEGEIAGYSAAGDQVAAQKCFRRREKARKFAHALNEAFQLRPELKSLPSEDTLVCRCEDVSYGSLRKMISWREAKLQTRCGMGPCQGRVCGAAAGFLLGWSAESVRPPVSPVRVQSLIRK